MKYRAAQRVLRERDRLTTEIATLETKKAEAVKTLEGIDAELAAASVAVAEARAQVARDLAERQNTVDRHTAERQWLKQKHDGELSLVNERIVESQTVEGKALAASGGVSVNRTHATQTLAALDPQRAELERQLRKLDPDLEAATAKVAAIEASERAKVAHMGDPCKFCGTAWDKVQPGPCPARIAKPTTTDPNAPPSAGKTCRGLLRDGGGGFAAQLGRANMTKARKRGILRRR